MDRGDRSSGSKRLLFAALLSLAVALILTFLKTTYPLDSVVKVDYYDGKIYGIDSDDYATTIFCVDPISGRGTYYKQGYSDSQYRQFSNLIVADDGTVFVLQEQESAKGGKAWAILVWDAEKNILRHGADIDFEESYVRLENIFKMGNTIQMLFYTGEKDGKIIFTRYLLDGNTVKRAGSISSDSDYHEIYLLDDRMAMVDAFGCVYYNDYKAGQFERLKDDNGEVYYTNGTRFCVVGHKLYYNEYLTGDCYKIDLNAEDVRAEKASNGMKLPTSFDFYSTSCIKYDSDWTMVCAVSLEDGRSVVGYNGIQDKVIDEVRQTDVRKLGTFLQVFLVCFAVTATAALRVRFTKGFLKKRSIKLRLSMSALVLTAVIYVLFELYMQIYLERYVTWNAINNCSAMAKIREYDLDMDVLENLLSKKVVEPKDDQSIWVTSRVYGSSSTDEGDLSNYIGFRVFYPVNDMIYSADQTMRYNIPVYLVAGRPTEDMARAALDTDTVQSGTLVYEGAKVVSVFVPAATESGQRYVLEAYMPIDEIISSMQKMNRKMTFWVVAFGVLIVLGIYAVITYCLRSLGYLKDAVLKVAEGELGAQARVVGHNEIASTAISFNRMSETLMRLNGVVDSYRRLYEAFVPMKLCEKLSGKDDTEISLEPGSVYSGYAYIMAMRFSGVSEDDQVELIRTQLDTGMSHGGIAAALAGKQKIVFCDSADSAVSSAVKLLEQLGSGQRVHIGIVGTHVAVNVLGCESRRSMTISDERDTELIEHLARYLDASLLISETVQQSLEKEAPGKYHSRYLGRLSIEGEETAQAIYEIMDSEPQAVRELKQMTAEHFDKGVRAYEDRSMFVARTEMIRVKMDFPKDRAARSYILCCDEKEPPVICRAEG